MNLNMFATLPLTSEPRGFADSWISFLKLELLSSEMDRTGDLL
jgi:hypothetical protein